MRKTHIVLLIFMVVALASIISLVYKADTYSSFKDARENPGKEYHIIGNLDIDVPVIESVIDNTLLLTFSMVDDKGYASKVHYLGAKPVDFEKSDQIVLIGKYEDNIFLASSLLLKCPSKYNADEIGDTYKY